MATPEKKNFNTLINLTSEAFSASAPAAEADESDQPKMVNNRQSVYRVPLSMIRPDRFQARILLPYLERDDFYSGRITWREAAEQWLHLGTQEPAMARELEELMMLGNSLQDTGQIKPITGQVVNEGGRDVFRMLTGERRFWATALKAVSEQRTEEPYVLALIDNQPSLEKQIAENMAYKELTAVGKARAAARLVLESNDIKPEVGEDELSFFRRVREVRLSDETRDLLAQTLQLERTYYGRLMRFFDLPEELLDACDRAEMPERVLREILPYDESLWRQAVEYYAETPGRTYQDVHAFLERLVGARVARAPRLPAHPTTQSARLLRRVLLGVETLPEQDQVGALADALVGDMRAEDARKAYEVLTKMTEAVRLRLDGLKR